MLGATAVSLPQTAAAQSLTSAFEFGKPIVNINLRYENVDQSNIANTGQALTMRARLGYQTGAWNGFTLLFDFDWITALTDRKYNDTVHPVTGYPVIADPDVVALDRLQLSYAFSDTTITAGRQAIILGNARFVGNVGWRQHQQTFDAISVVNTSLPDTTITGVYAQGVNRIFSEESVTQVGHFDTETFLLNIANKNTIPSLALEGFAYFIDIEESPALSNQTFGLRAVYDITLSDEVKASLIGSYAQQSDYGNAPVAFDADYWNLEANINYDVFSLGFGQETMGSDTSAGKGFMTPLATLHAFDGWADVFLTTPSAGLDDLYAKASYKFVIGTFLTGASATIVYHDYTASSGGADYGSEWDAQITGSLGNGFSIGVKYADYQTGGVIPVGAQSAAFDKRVGWLWLTYAL